MTAQPEPTPRTDAKAFTANFKWGIYPGRDEYISADVARQLERERNQWQDRAERICNLVLRLNADEGLSASALAGLQRMANAALGKQS